MQETDRRSSLRSKTQKLTVAEVDILVTEVAAKRSVSFGSLTREIKGCRRSKIWKAVALSVSSVSAENGALQVVCL